MTADGFRHGFDPALLDPLTDFLLLSALSRAEGKVVYAGQGGKHEEYLLDEHARQLRGTRCYFNLEAQVPSLLTRLTPRRLADVEMARVNLYLSPAGCGAPLHFDVRDVCIVQLFGSKTWHLSDVPALEAPLSNCVFPDGEDQLSYQGQQLLRPQRLQTHALRPGCWLWVPKGVWHRTYSEQGSVSATLATVEA